MKDYYGTLNLTREATPVEIKKAYFTLVRKYPPEKHPAEFMQIREAYEVLIDENTRREYDLVDSMPDVVIKYFQEGLNALRNGEAVKAIRLLEQVTSVYPNFSVVNSLLGDAYLENGNSGKAIRIFESLVERERNNAGYARRLAHAYAMRGWHRKGIDQYHRALQLDEDNISLWLGLIECYMAGHDFLQAKQTVFEGLEVSNRNGWDNLELYYHIIQIDIFSRDYDNMQKHLAEMQQKAREKEEEKPRVAWFLATLAKKINAFGLHREAVETVEAASVLLPGDAEVVKIKDEINAQSGLQAELERLSEDEEIDMEVDEMLKFELEKCDNPLCQECAFTEFYHEMDIVMELDRFRKQILRLKKTYPTLYKLKKDFFDTVLNRKKQDYLLDTYYKKYRKYKKLHPERFDVDEDDDRETADSDDFNIFEPEDYNPQPYVRSEPKVGRNDPCPCGSGKKYKKCCVLR